MVYATERLSRLAGGDVSVLGERETARMWFDVKEVGGMRAVRVVRKVVDLSRVRSWRHGV